MSNRGLYDRYKPNCISNFNINRLTDPNTMLRQLSMGFQEQEQFKNNNNNYMLLTRIHFKNKAESFKVK